MKEATTERSKAASRGRTQACALAIACLTAALAAGCYPTAGAPPGALSPDSVAKASTRWPGVTESSLAEGRELFLAKCNACHGYPDLASISEEDWPSIVERMARKADLQPKQGDAILHWVLAARPATPSGT